MGSLARRRTSAGDTRRKLAAGRIRDKREALVTDVFDGPLGADASETREDPGGPFPSDKVGNSASDDSGWVLDDLLSSGARSGQADRPAVQGLTLPVRRPPWASRRMGAAAPV